MTIENELRSKIEIQNDVKKVHRLRQIIGTKNWHYLIETPFETYPKFVVGICDSFGDPVQIETTCGLLKTAIDFWQELYPEQLSGGEVKDL